MFPKKTQTKKTNNNNRSYNKINKKTNNSNNNKLLYKNDIKNYQNILMIMIMIKICLVLMNPNYYIHKVCNYL